MEQGEQSLLRVGELARAVGKSVRAIHLYEELGLVKPATRSSGGFRLFAKDAVDRINWITKLQAIGFSLPEIQGFVGDFEASESGREATGRVRDVFAAKLRDTREQIDRLEGIESDLKEALAYLESCVSCTGTYTPDDCHVCDLHGHRAGDAPELFAGLSKVAVDGDGPEYDVEVQKLRREPGSPR